MRKIILVLGLLLCAPMLAHAEGKFIVNGVNGGQFTDLAITGANTTNTKKSGLKATIDLSTVSQTTVTAVTTPVEGLTQLATTGPIFGVTCTSGITGSTAAAVSSCGSYTTTVASKIGSIKVFINGVAGFIDVKALPN